MQHYFFEMGASTARLRQRDASFDRPGAILDAEVLRGGRAGPALLDLLFARSDRCLRVHGRLLKQIEEHVACQVEIRRIRTLPRPESGEAPDDPAVPPEGSGEVVGPS